MSYQVEWVLLCGAFERILEAKPKAEDVAEKFAAKMVPASPVLASSAKRRSSGWSSATHLRYEWMKEFYGIRGEFAHGKLVTKRPAVWKPLEHLVLATIALPLVVRCLLGESGRYALKGDDQARVDVFEKLADENFLMPPSDRAGSHDSVFSRLVASAKIEAAKQRAIEKLEGTSA